MTRWSANSALFPYTTLFRSQTRRACIPSLGSFSLADFVGKPCRQSDPAVGAVVGQRRKGSEEPKSAAAAPRSEEHTSELQSRGHLVCRLLLEKKKKKVTLKQ